MHWTCPDGVVVQTVVVVTGTVVGGAYGVVVGVTSVVGVVGAIGVVVAVLTGRLAVGTGVVGGVADDGRLASVVLV